VSPFSDYEHTSSVKVFPFAIFQHSEMSLVHKWSEVGPTSCVGWAAGGGFGRR
jgi:hypothetical protein